MTDRGGGHRRADHPSREVLADRLRPSWRDGFGRAAGPSPAGRRRSAATRAASLVVVVALGAAAVAHAVHPPAARRSDRIRLVGVSLDVPPPGPRGAAPAAVVATYRVSGRQPGTRVRLSGVTGPLVAASAARRLPASATRPSAVFRVDATPRCQGPSALAAGRSRYAVTATRTSADGRSTRERLDGSLDWGAALRQVCWQQVATNGVDVVGVRAQADPRRHQLILTVLLRSLLRADVAIRVIDVADVSTLSAADHGVLRATGRRAFRVRWPVADCAAPTLPRHTFVATPEAPGRVVAALEWSVGPPGADPAALFVTTLSAAQLASVRAGVRRLCGT